ncbi:membrane-associated protein, putative [Bodo saltans]|uniref:Membrane-associated protein, putative n=1 Tax=Bodo saltans TaxID=75058 RepID=A0A0S4JMX2_BODSA|nr:membrane-associated protein, putative [Bodo saltans]|eukprot:CUG92853.1 membrane-associated protein, putative [Bodo saltans]
MSASFPLASSSSPIPLQQRNSTQKQKRHHSKCVCTIPLWLGCAVLCTILVGVVGFSPFLALQSYSEGIVSTARNTYNQIFAINGQSMYYKYLNEATSPILAYYQAYNKPRTMTAMNFSDPMWDRDWQLFFTGVAALNPERYYYYMDLATGSFTGQYVRGADKLRIVGNVNDVNFTGYRQSATPPLRFTPTAENVSLEFPPSVMFNNFFATGEASYVIQSALSTNGELVYGLATYIGGPYTTPPGVVPVGALLELIPLEDMVNLTAPAQTSVSRDTETVVLDYLGALVASTVPALTNIYLPVGTPGAICNTVTYLSRSISKCRHSIETLRPVWPLVYAAQQAITNRVEGVVVGSFSTVSYVTFEFNDNEYLVSAQFPVLSNSGWWTASITPIDPVYGPYIANRRRILIIVSCVVAGVALLALVITYVLMRPLGKLMEEMIAALKLQSQTDRYAKATAAAESLEEHHRVSTTSAIVCQQKVQVGELHEIELAVVSLYELLEDVAKMLPPPVILMIRTTLAQRAIAFSVSASSSGSTLDEGSIAHSSSDDQSDDDDSPRRLRPPKGKHSAADDVVQMLAWFEDHYRIKDNDEDEPVVAGEDELIADDQVADGNVLDPTVSDVVTVPVAASADSSANLKASSSIETEGVIEVVALETRAQRQRGKNDDDQHQPRATILNESGILMGPSVSLRPARRRGFFMAISLTEFKCETSQFAEAIAPLLSLVWHYSGEVELIERSMLLATFGCYEMIADAADRAAACAMAIVEPKPVRESSRITPQQAAAMINRRSTADSNNNGHQKEQAPAFSKAPIHVRCSVAIDCGWFETSTFSCLLPSGKTMRRLIVTSVARDVAVKMLPLAEVLDERLLISGDALRHINPETFLSRVPVIVDHLKFDAQSWSKVSRRSSVFVFAVPAANPSTEARPVAMISAQSFTVNDIRKNDARVIAEGFRLMVNGQYIDAEMFFRRSNERGGLTSNRTLTRMLAISSAIAEIQRARPATSDMGAYYRGECPSFEANMNEEMEFRERQARNHNVINNSLTSVEGYEPRRLKATASSNAMDRSYSGGSFRDLDKGKGNGKSKKRMFAFS